jgi:phenylacetaldehyde dehydrogenase
VDLAVTAASRAFESGIWSELHPAERARILLRLADLIEEIAEELGQIEALNSGMLASMAGMIPAQIATYLRYFAGWATKIHGITSEISSPLIGPIHAYTSKQPVGVCGLITPWNFPLSLVAVKLAALAAGCTCVVKPSEETPFSTLRLVELLHKAGAPGGVVNVVTGLGREAGAAIAAHPKVAKVAFTGSTATGKEIVKAAAGNLKKVALELDGNLPSSCLTTAIWRKPSPAWRWEYSCAAVRLHRGLTRVCAQEYIRRVCRRLGQRRAVA